MALLLLHGLSGNEPDHWQTWVAREARRVGIEVLYPNLPFPDEPTVGAWVDAVQPLAQRRRPDGVLDVLAHSLGCHLWAHVATSPWSGPGWAGAAASRVLLVAPPGEPEVHQLIPTFEPAALTVGLRAACPRTTVLLGENDPWLSDPAPLLASGLAVRQVARGRHLNVESGYGPWPAMARWVRGGRLPGRRMADAATDT